jgi:hypothetical protein
MDVAPLQPPAAPPPVKKTTNLMKKQRDSIVHRNKASNWALLQGGFGKLATKFKVHRTTFQQLWKRVRTSHTENP